MKPLAILLVFTAAASCSPIGPFGVLTDARIDVPLNPNNIAESLSQTSTYSVDWTIDVTGGVGQGYLKFWISLAAESFGWSPYAEYMDSWSAIYVNVAGPFGLNTSTSLAQGSTSVSCYGAAVGCLLPFTFGVPQDVVFTARSVVSYSYNPWVAGSIPLLAGDSIESSTTMSFVGVEDSHANPVDATVSFVDPPADVPEPTPFLLIGAGLLLISSWLRPRSEA